MLIKSELGTVFASHPMDGFGERLSRTRTRYVCRVSQVLSMRHENTVTTAAHRKAVQADQSRGARE